ncbi:MAG: hypothetical protein WCO06_02815 [Candidatus Roizmanbacteria bacterium]
MIQLNLELNKSYIDEAKPEDFSTYSLDTLLCNKFYGELIFIIDGVDCSLDDITLFDFIVRMNELTNNLTEDNSQTYLFPEGDGSIRLSRTEDIVLVKADYGAGETIESEISYDELKNVLHVSLVTFMSEIEKLYPSVSQNVVYKKVISDLLFADDELE